MATESAGIWSSLGQSAYGRRVQRTLAAEVGFYGEESLKKPIGKLSFLGGSATFKGGTSSVKGAAMAFGRGAARALPGVGTAYFVYQGYKEDGVWGAAREGAYSVAAGLAFEGVAMGFSAIGGLPVVLGAAAVAGAGYAGYQFGEAAQRYEKRIRETEMGAEVVDRFGTISTLRQRSLMALQNSHINGRMAIGNEALLMHTSF